MERRDRIWDWRWPENGREQSMLEREVLQITSPYEEKIPPVCYPGTVLPLEKFPGVEKLMAKQLNAIGTHTNGKWINENWEPKKGEGGFEKIQRMEAQALWMISSVMGGDPESIDGYFCGGGTEANLQGMWVGREWLREHDDPHQKGVAVFTSSLFHYSIVKAAEMLDIGSIGFSVCPSCGKNHIIEEDPSGNVNIVRVNKNGEMSLSHLEELFRQRYDEGFRRFMIVATAGNYLMGTIDPIKEIGSFISSSPADAHFYMHVDASFAGFTIPFIDESFDFAFSVEEVMSVTVDGDKMGRLPYPAGIFLCRKGLMSLVARKVNYVRGNEDNTVSGSRSAIAQVIAWYLYQAEGKNGQRKYVESCIKGRDKLVSVIREKLPWVNVLPCSPLVNFAPIEVNIHNGEIPEKMIDGDGILAPYHMRHGFLSTEPNKCPIVVYKVCVMPHCLPHFEEFVADIERAKKQWQMQETTAK